VSIGDTPTKVKDRDRQLLKSLMYCLGMCIPTDDLKRVKQLT